MFQRTRPIRTCFSAARGSILLLAVATTAATGQVVDLAVQNTQSNVNIQICLTPPGLSTKCDLDASPMSGTISLELDNYVNPGTISINDFTLALDNNLSFTMDWGFFIGSVDIQLVNGVVHYATPGLPTGPVALDNAGNFDFPILAVNFTGTGAFQGHGPIMGSVGSGTFNLADFGTNDSSIAGAIAIANDLITLSGAQSFANTGDINGVTTTLGGDATLLATGSVPTCRVDINGDGIVNTQDFLAYLNLWTVGNPEADFTGDGVVNTQDFLLFLNEWTVGCP